MKEELRVLIKYRLEKADEALSAARLLFDNGMYGDSVGRSYYAMFYAVLALLIPENVNTSKHQGVIAYFDREFVRSGKFDKKFSDWLHSAFNIRLRADYAEMVKIDEAQARELIEMADNFVEEIKSKIVN